MKNNGETIPFLKQKDYIMINNNLGGGSFGKTVLLQDPFIDELFVAKKYEPAHDEIKERFYKNFLDEIKILYKLNHKNIVRIYNYYAYENIFTGYILMEYIDGTDIENYIYNCAIWNEGSIDDVFIQLIDGFKYIEENSVIHRDIRENNILVDKNGTVKIIDFGIGKIFEQPDGQNDSLKSEINRKNSDTLPDEYYQGVYTSKTDMFYIGELLNRLIVNAGGSDSLSFSYQYILNKMMKKNPNNRFSSFAEIRDIIDRHDFINMNITDKDKLIYQKFSNKLYQSLSVFIDERKFNYDNDLFITTIERVLRNNCFEDLIQQNEDVIRAVVVGGFKYKRNVNIECTIVKNFLEWFKKSDKQSQKLILNNIIIKLSSIPVEEREPDLPF